MNRFVGLDVHKRTTVACFVDKKGRVVKQATIATTREALTEFGQKILKKKDAVALESTTNAWGVVEILEPYAGLVVVSNPRKTKAIADAKIKTDKVDAQVLAQLLRTNFLPLVWVPDEATKQLRRLMSRRKSLVHRQTRVKNRIHSILHQLLIHAPFERLFTKKGHAWLASVEMPAWGRRDIDSERRLLEALEREIDLLDDELAKVGYSLEKVRLLMTLPGVDVNTAITLLAALGNVERFEEPDRAVGYLGLAPSTRQSGSKCYHGPITKQGNTGARWMLIQAAQHVRTHPGPIGNFYRKLTRKKCHNIAVVAAARKLVVYAWHMLKNNEPYRYAQPAPTKTKLTRLRVRATGRKRKTGPKKGTKPPRNYGTGKKTKLIPAINDVYSEERVPTTRCYDELSAGERMHLRRSKLVTTIRSNHVSHRVEKRRATKDTQPTG